MTIKTFVGVAGALVLLLPAPGGPFGSCQAFCPPLPPPSGNVTPCQTVTELENAVNGAQAGDTITLGDGTYSLNGVYLRIRAPGVTLRSASGDRGAVVLDGNYQTTEIIQIAASGATIADVTLRRPYYHAVHVMSTDEGNTDNVTLYNVHIVDPGQQAVKINPVPGGFYADDGTIACCHIELTAAGRAKVRDINGRCYTGGVDAHGARGWRVRDCRIEGFWCPDGLSEHAVHFWKASRDTVVERNVLHNNARGVGFGLLETGDGRSYADDPCPAANGAYVGHYGGIVRNNFVSAADGGLLASEYGFDCGICLWQACGVQVLHNSVASTQAPFSSIEWRFNHAEAEIVNNLASHNLRDRGGTSVLSGNLTNQPLTVFCEVAAGDLHLPQTAGAAIDGVTAPAEAGADIDGDPRPLRTRSDVGADEVRFGASGLPLLLLED